MCWSNTEATQYHDSHTVYSSTLLWAFSKSNVLLTRCSKCWCATVRVQFHTGRLFSFVSRVIFERRVSIYG